MIKGGPPLEMAYKVDCVVFDKTRTLTLGKTRVAAFRVLGQHTEEEVLRLAASVESGSEHPLAQARCSCSPRSPLAE